MIKILIKYILYFSPAPIKKYLDKKISKKRLEQGMARYKRTKVTKKQVEDILDKIDFDHDIILHTSTLNIGRIEGGPKWLAEQIVSRCDLKNHTLLVSALPYFGSFVDYLETNPLFDVSSAPIAVGAVNERIATMEGVRRSVHPTHSVLALGKESDFYTCGHHFDSTPFGPNSPYHKLLANKGHVLLFGATVNNLTITHAVEDILGEHYPVKNIYSRKKYQVSCINASGEKLTVETTAHDKFTCIRRDGMFIEDDGLRHGYIKRYALGEGYVYEVDACALALRYCELLKEGRSIYGRCKKMNKDVNINIGNSGKIVLTNN